ncbi:DNA polymerase IV [Catellatospora bangladeshensis]|uniref:DNA polymerase IV n=1 Tax=Catellatospora bangladeshensis TaxID=310355 RepID=A0A8J3NF31_9ACTN|nr:DNA polymerase IV [Catellatospora bangladeshensis]GIF79015.1 DNA polymerase IV [Catellatospora bangladeshensis]
MGRASGGGAPKGFGPDGDDSGCPFLHIDMDAFFASVEVRRRPELRGLPVVVGGTGGRGVVSSASYEAREYGVRSAMPTAMARARCPQAIFIPPDMEAYAQASRAVMAVFRDITPLVEPLSVDEAFLDVSGSRRLFGRPAEIAALIRRRIAEEQQLTCSIGVAPNKFLAKLGSTRAKPDGLLVIPADRALKFLHPLPVSVLWGVGERTEESLRRLGMRTVADVAHAGPGLLRAAVGQAMAAHLHELAWGRDPRQVSTEHQEKSIGAEVTFDTDLGDPEQLRKMLLALAQKVAARARASGQAGRTVSIKVRFADFRTISRSRTLPGPTDVAHEIMSTAWELFEAVRAQQRIRLVGVRLEGLLAAEGAVRQLALGEAEDGWREAEVASDAVIARFGRGAVRPASLLGTTRRSSGAARPLPQNPAPGMVVPLSDPPTPS